MFNNTLYIAKRKIKTYKKDLKLLKGIMMYYWFILMIKLFRLDLETIICLILSINLFNFILIDCHKFNNDYYTKEPGQYHNKQNI